MSNGCPECEHYRSCGYEFCPACGRDLRNADGCPERADSTIYTSCGRASNGTPATEKPDEGARQTELTRDRLFRIASTVLLAIFFLTLFCAITYSLIHAGEIMDSLTSFDRAMFVMSIAAIVFSAIFAVWNIYSKTHGGKDPDAVFTTGVNASATGLSVSLAFTIAYVLILALFGKSLDSSWMDEYSETYIQYMLFVAGPQEEFLFRLLPLGLPMVVVAFFCGKPHARKYAFGGFGVSRWSWVFIIFSASIFGYAHIGGWGWTKIIDAFAGGVIFGYIFVQYGLYASILAHTVNDTFGFISYIGLGDAVSALAEYSFIAIGFLILVLWIIHPNRDNTDVRNMPWINGDLPDSVLKRWNRH